VNFPGGGTSGPSSASIFVTKLNPSATAVLFTTVLGSLTLGSPQNLQDLLTAQYVTGLGVDQDGSIYLAGFDLAANFPTTPKAWVPNSGTQFVTKLDSSGKLVYSSYVGPPSWALRPQRLRVRNGIAYIAGFVSAPAFSGTAGALQPNIAGGQDLFALAMAPDGSAPLFVTAFGGSGDESLNDMTLDAAGNIVLIGASSSANLPVTADALPYPPPVPPNSESILVRIDPTGSTLVSSTWLGTAGVNAGSVTSDGGLVIAGVTPFPPDLTSGAPSYSINLGGTVPGYLAKLAPGSNRLAWSTVELGNDNFESGIVTDAGGNVYWSGFPDAISGGAIGAVQSGGITGISADGSQLRYSSPVPGVTDWVRMVPGPGGILYVAGYTYSGALPVTPGVIQPQINPGPAQQPYDPLASTDGFVGKLDLSAFDSGNFFVMSPSSGYSLVWRIGEPAPQALTIPVNGGGGSLSAAPGPGLVASLFPYAIACLEH
jgi:hypothetical protein